MQPQYSQGAVTSHHSSYAAATEISGNGGSITSSLRQWRKKDYVDKQQSNDSSASVAENTSHVARVAPHTYYPPRPANDVCHYQHQYSEYGDPYKPPPVVAPVKYSEIVESQPPQPIENIAPIIQKHKEKEYVDFPPPQPHLKQYQELPLKPPYPDSLKQAYSDQYMVKESQMPPYMQKQSQMHQYMQKEPYQQFLSKYNMQNQYPSQPYPSEPNNFLAHLNKINPRMAQSIINDTHLRDPMYHNLEQNRTYQQSQRMYHGPPMNSSPTHPHRNMPPQGYNYPPQPYNCSVKQGNDPYNRIQYQHGGPKYLPDYKMNSPIEPTMPNISPQGLYNERLHMNYGPMSPNFPPCNQLEYAQHYQHRRSSQIPPEYFSHPGFKAQYMENLHMVPDDNCSNPRGRKPSLKQYLETWVDEDLTGGNLPDIIISNNMNESNMDNPMKSTVCVKSNDKQEQPLYVLDSTEIPDENLPHFLHLQQFEKLPDNIRGYYHSANAVNMGNRRIIVQNEVACGSKIDSRTTADRIGMEGCAVVAQNKTVDNQGQALENKVVQIHIIEAPEPVNNAAIDSCSAPDTVIVKSNVFPHNLILDNDQSLHILNNEGVKENVKNMPVIDDGFTADEASDCLGGDSLTQSEDSSSNQSNSDEQSQDVFVNQGDVSSGISSIYKEMENLQNDHSNIIPNSNTGDASVESGSTDSNKNCNPEQTDNAFNAEISDYLHSSSDNLEFDQTTNALQEPPPTLTFDSLTSPNSDEGDTPGTDVNLPKTVSDDLEHEVITSVCGSICSEVENISSPEKPDDCGEVKAMLESIIDEVACVEPNRELTTLLEEQSLTESVAMAKPDIPNDNSDTNSSEGTQFEECDTASAEPNTKDLTSDNIAGDQSSDDDTSMPDIDKCVGHTPEANQPDLEIISIDLTGDETNNYDNYHGNKEFSRQADSPGKCDDFEKPPDLTDSKFGIEIKKEIITNEDEEPSILKENESVQSANEKVILNIEPSFLSSENTETTDVTIPHDKPHKRHRSRSDRPSKKYKEKRRTSHPVTDISQTPEPTVEKTNQETKDSVDKEKKENTQLESPKSNKFKLKPTELLKHAPFVEKHEVVEESLNTNHGYENSNTKFTCKEENKCRDTPKPKSKKINSKSRQNSETIAINKERTFEGHFNSEVPCGEESESVDEPLTMIKVEQSYLEETYQSTNTNVIYQISESNVLLQIADELLEINVTTQSGRKVILVKTLTDAIILSNSDENVVIDLDEEPEELRYERICEDVEILLNNNNYIMDTRESNNNEECFEVPKAVCDETEVPVFAGAEEIVSSSTAEHESKQKSTDDLSQKPAAKPKKVTWEDEKQQQHSSDNLQQLSSVAIKRPKTKGALKYLGTNITEPLQSIPPIPEKPKKPKIKSKKPKLDKPKDENKSSEMLNAKIKPADTKSEKNTEANIKTIEKSTKSKKRKAASPSKNIVKKKESLPIKIKKEKIGTHVLKTKIKDKSKVESPKSPRTVEAIEGKPATTDVQLRPQEVHILFTDVVQPVPAEVSKKCEQLSEPSKPSDAKVDSEEKQISVQEHSITSSTSVQEPEAQPGPVELKLAQQISEEWEEDADEVKAPPPATNKKRLSLEEYNSRKRLNTNTEQALEQSDLTNNLLGNINYNNRELSPDSPVLSVNFSNKTYSRNLSLSSKGSLSPNGQYDSLTNSIELQLPKISRIPPRPVYSEEYLQNALRNDLHTVNAFTTSLIKENQQLMQRFLNQQRLTLDELKKVKQIIRYKRLIQQLTTLKINGLTSSSKYDHFSIRHNLMKPHYQNVYDLDKGQSSATKVTMEDPLKSFNFEPEKRKRKRFKFLYSSRESALNPSRKLPTIVSGERDPNAVKRLRLEDPMNPESEESGVGYSVYQGGSQSQLTLVFKRSSKNDPRMQPYVKLERLFSIDQLAKNRYY